MGQTRENRKTTKALRLPMTCPRCFAGNVWQDSKGSWCSVAGCNWEEDTTVMASFLKAAVEFIKAVHDDDLNTFHEYKSGNALIIDGFIGDPHGSGWLAITRNSPEEQISEICHLSRIQEFNKLYDVECAYEELEQRQPLTEPDDEIEKEVCPSCGYIGDPLSGDEVYFGYTGYPMCPQCKTV